MSDDPAWMGKPQSLRRQNARSRAQERQIAREVGGRVQAGSGSSRRAPQDIKSDDDLYQVKYTDKDSYRLTNAEWDKVRKDALTHGREPAMIVEFTKTGRRLRITEG